MVKKITLLSFLVLVLISVASVQGIESDEKGSISGKILPIDSNAIVYAISPTKEIAGSSLINENGEYSIAVSLGIYDLLIVAEGDYANRTVFQVGVKENEVTELQDITLPKIGEVGSISGYINPVIPSTIVKIKKFGLTDFAGESIVDNDGRYYFTNLEPDAYGLFVDFNPSQGFYNYKWGMIDIVANISLSGINLTFTPRTSKHLLDRILVEFQPGILGSEKREIINSFNSRIMSHYSYSRNYVVSVPPDKTPEEMIDLFKTNPNVKNAYLNQILSVGGDIVGTDEDRQIILEKESREEINTSNDTSVQPIPEIEDVKKDVVVKEEENVIEQEKQVEIEPSQNNEVEQPKSFLSIIVDWIKSLFSK